MNIEYHDDAWDYFANKDGKERFELPSEVDIFNDCDYVLVIDGHNRHFDNPHIGDLYSHKPEHWIANMFDKRDGKPYTVVITWHG